MVILVAVKVVPHIFFHHPTVDTLFKEGNGAIFFKEVPQDTSRGERYLAVHVITQVLTGQLQVEDHQGNFTQVKAGEFIFLPKGIYFVSDLVPDQGKFAAMVYCFPDLMLESWAGEANIVAKQLPFLQQKTPDALKRYVASLLDLYQPVAPLNYPLTRPKLSEMLHLLGRSAIGDDLKQAVQALIHRKRLNLRQFMLANFSKPLGVEDYAYLCGRSLSTFQREFKRTFGESPKRWLIQQRLQKASILLQREGKSVSEAALEVGYEDFSHFSKAFRKQFGVSPRQFAGERQQQL